MLKIDEIHSFLRSVINNCKKFIFFSWITHSLALLITFLIDVAFFLHTKQNSYNQIIPRVLLKNFDILGLIRDSLHRRNNLFNEQENLFSRGYSWSW